MTLEHIAQAVQEATRSHFRLAIVVGPPRSGKTHLLQHLAKSTMSPVINVNLRLSERLLDLTQRQRPVRVQRILATLIEEQVGEPVILDNIELLFGAELRLDPLRVLQQLARNRTIVAAWPGQLDDGVLSYAEPGHPEARRYINPEAAVVLATAPVTSAAQSNPIEATSEAEDPK